MIAYYLNTMIGNNLENPRGILFFLKIFLPNYTNTLNIHKKILEKQSWDCTWPRSGQTGTGTLFYFIQDLFHKMD